MSSSVANHATPPALSHAHSSASSSFDVSGCLPTPSPEVPSLQRLRGIEWVTRGRKPSKSVSQAVASTPRRVEEPLPPTETAPLSQPASGSPTQAHARIQNSPNSQNFPEQTATQQRHLARELFWEDAHLYATAPQSSTSAWVAQQKTLSGAVVSHESGTGQLASTRAPSAVFPAEQRESSAGPLADVIAESSEQAFLWKPGFRPKVHSAKFTYGRNAASTGKQRSERSEAWHVLRRRVVSEPPDTASSAETAADQEANALEPRLTRARAPSIQPDSLCGSAISLPAPPRRRDFGDSAPYPSRQPLRPKKRPQARLAVATTASDQEWQDTDIAVPLEGGPPDNAVLDDISGSARPPHQMHERASKSSRRRQKSPYLSRRAVRALKAERAEQKRQLDEYGHTYIHKAILEHPILEHPAAAGHNRLEIGYMVPTPRDKAKKQRKFNAQPQSVRKYINVPAKIEETSFGSHLETRKRKRRRVQESSQELGDDNFPPPLPVEDYVGATPPFVSPIRKPLSELRAGRYAVEQAEEREKQAAAQSAENSSESHTRARKKVRFDGRTSIQKGHSALKLGPAIKVASPCQERRWVRFTGMILHK